MFRCRISGIWRRLIQYRNRLCSRRPSRRHTARKARPLSPLLRNDGTTLIAMQISCSPAIHLFFDWHAASALLIVLVSYCQMTAQQGDGRYCAKFIISTSAIATQSRNVCRQRPLNLPTYKNRLQHCRWLSRNIHLIRFLYQDRIWIWRRIGTPYSLLMARPQT